MELLLKKQTKPAGKFGAAVFSRQNKISDIRFICKVYHCGEFLDERYRDIKAARVFKLSIKFLQLTIKAHFPN